MDIKNQKGGDGSVNIQGDSINIRIYQQPSLPNRIFNAEFSKINDILYDGRPKQWESTIDRVKNLLGADQLPPAVLLDLANNCAIGRIRKEIDSKLPLLFTDTSWITHSISFWNDDPQMQRWLNALGKVASERAKKNLETFRVFFWDSAVITSQEQLLEMSRTLVSHLNYGISVVLLDVQFGYRPIDVHVYTKADGLYSKDFSIFNIGELNDRDTIFEYLKYVPGFCAKLPDDGSAIFLTPLDTIKTVENIITRHCPKIRNLK